MAASELRRTTVSVLFKKTASIFTALSFVAAAVFLVAVLWLPANAASSSSAVDSQPSLLLTLDKPQTPAPKLNPNRLPSFTDDEKALVEAGSPDLVTELNNWTYTQSPVSALFTNFVAQQFFFTNALHFLYVEVSWLKAFALFDQSIYQSLGLPVPGFLTTVINNLSSVQNTLSAFR